MLEIRQERPEERRAVETLVREAFWNVYAPGCSEHWMVHVLRGVPTFVPELNLVALQKGRLVGHVLNVRARIEGDDGRPHEVLSLGPIAVAPACQRQGIGARLLTTVKDRARALGFQAILLCGNPAFYTKQGFVAAETYRIRNAENCFADALHVCLLEESIGPSLAGRYLEDPHYDVRAADVAAFDRPFPPKPLVSDTPSQRLFLEMVTRVRPYSPKALKPRG